MTGASPAWTPEADAELTRLWSDPTLSARAIAEQMGCTKGAAIGRVHRLGLPGRPSPLGKSAPASKVGKPKPVTRKPLAADIPAVVGPATVFRPRAAGACQWIEGSGPPWRFCNQPTISGSSWCASHHAWCFAKPRGERAA